MKFSKLAAIGLSLVAGTVLVFAQDAPKTKPQPRPAAGLQPGAAPAPAPATAPIADLKGKASYAIGLGFGQNIKEQGLDLDAGELAQGLNDGLSGAEPKLSEADIEKVMTAFRDEFVAQQTAKAQAAAVKNKKEGDAFLAQNKTKPGVKTTRSGLQYQTVKEGNGPAPKPTDVVKVHYRGTLLDGTEFDSSYKRNEPIEFPLNRVIPGWTEGLQLMKVGGKSRLFVPSGLAYGENPPPGSVIEPNSVLVFDVELLGVTPGAPAPATPRGAIPK